MYRRYINKFIYLSIYNIKQMQQAPLILFHARYADSLTGLYISPDMSEQMN